MPPSLHRHLRQALASDDLYLCPEDSIEDVPAEHHDPEQRAAKRRRVEAIAARYLRGQPPVIVTAGLRGPFNSGWKNPWTKPAKGKQKAAQISQARQKRRSRVHSIASPETSRAPRDINLSAREHDDSLSDVEVPPSTAPLPDEDEACATTESFSVDIETCTRRQSCSTNPFWLRRPDSPRVDMRNATNEQSDPSPTRSRSRPAHSQIESVAQLSISFPKGPVDWQRSSPERAFPENCKSSASASMDISSLVNGENSTRSGTAYPAQLACTPYSTEPAQRSQRTVPIVTSSMGSQPTISREDIQHSAERLVDCISSAASSRLSQQPKRKASQKTCRAAQQDTISPLQASSLTSPRRKSGQANKSSNRLCKPKPRAINFDSSPDKASPVVKQGKRRADTVERLADKGKDTGTDEDEQTTMAPQSAKETTGVPCHEGKAQESHSSRDSEWCTQAAMVRAQLEFQQSTFPTLSPATLEAESQVSLKTPRAMLGGPGRAITPLANLAVPRGEALPSDSVFLGPPVSTQDLFGAASPFSFSTVKKKGDDSQASSLRLGLGAGEAGALKLGDATNNSPTPQTGRIPLKDKNTKTGFWSFVSEKASQGSPGWLGERSRRSAREIEFAQLRLDASLDDLGRHVAGSFVRGIEEG